MAELMLRSEKERGQLILVTGFVLAITLVAIVLLLNTTIYTENIASRGVDRSPEEAVEFRVSVRESVGELVLSVDDETYDQDEFEGILANLSRMLERTHSDRGTIAYVNNSSFTVEEGTLIQQTNDTRNFRSDIEDWSSNWTVARDIQKARNVIFTFNIPESLSGSAQNAFHVKLINSTNSSDMWSGYFYEGNDTIRFTTSTDGGSGIGSDVCEVEYDNGSATVDMTAGTVEGVTCDGIEWWDGEPPTSYDLRFINVSKATGTFNMTFGNNTELNVNTNFYASDPSDGPSDVENVLYSTTIPIRYQTATLSYEINITVAPGEPDYAE